jgi:type I restriction enzyme S subunit
MSFPRYENYTSSRVEWLGEVPAHWQIGMIRNFARLESGHTPSRQHREYWENCTIPWFTLADVWQIREGKTKYIFETKELVSELGLKNSSARLLPKGTVILSRTASVGFSAIMGCDMATTQDFANWVCGPDLLPEFLLAALRGMKGEFDRLMMGSTHKTIYMPDIAKLAIAVPPLPEQTAIAAFLDREAKKIDALVQEQQRLIALLKEKRQAVISRAVTRGLDPNARLKESGVEWLGKIPEHWEVRRISGTLSEVDEPGGDELPILSVSIHHGVSDREFGSDELERKITRSDDRSKYKRVRPGDLVYNMMRAWQGAFGAVQVEGAVSPAYVVARPKTDLLTPFLEYLLRTPQAIEEMRRHSKGVTDFRLRLYWDDFKAIQIALPPKLEQEEILEAIVAANRQTEALAQETETAIALLQERRSALISAAVTGKIDVRGLAPGEAEAA